MWHAFDVTAGDGDGRLRPLSFAADLDDWGPWVLVNGLPKLPEAVGEGEAVPVALWVGTKWAATMHLVYRRPDDDDPDDEPSLDTQEQAFYRRGDEWEAAGGDGGANWWPGLGLTPAPLGPRDAFADGFGGYACPDWSAGVVSGVAGSAAAMVEVETADGIESAPFTSPVGAWIVAFDALLGATVRVRDVHGGILCEKHVEPDA